MGLLEILEPVYNVLPEVKAPEAEPTIKKKLIWSSLALVLFFVMGNIELIGLSVERGAVLAQMQTILASNTGSLISAGIGPIVLASIILQLLVGGKILNIDLTNPQDKIKFQGLQKLFAIVLCFFEAFVYTASGLLEPMPGMLPAIVLQVALGSLILLYLDELVAKHGVGSGVGLFIAGGVSAGFFWQVFAPPVGELSAIGGGILSRFAASIVGGSANFLSLIPIIIAIAIFAIIVFAEGMHVNIPITMGRRGTGGRFPVKLLYVSNMPVILAAALFANVKIWSMMVKDIPFLGESGLPLPGGGLFGFLTWATSAPYNLLQDLVLRLIAEGPVQGLMIMAPAIGHAFVYLAILISACVVFGKFWVQMGGQGPEAVAEQLQSSGMYIPGFRRDKRIIRSILDRYIPTITIMGSVFVGILAGLGDMSLGTLTSGMGILLTVGIVYRLYEEIARSQLSEMHPMLGKLLGG